jgi:hypothetical protein
MILFFAPNSQQGKRGPVGRAALISSSEECRGTSGSALMPARSIPRCEDCAQSSSSDPSIQAALRRLDQCRRSRPTSHNLTLAEVNQERTVYLVEVEDEDELAGWLVRHHQELFEEELNGWYTDPALWPQDRSLKMLQEWCSLELHTVVLDTGESPLQDDEFEE